MNRRNFLNKLLLAGVGFSILPGSGRIWKAIKDKPVVYRYPILLSTPISKLDSLDVELLGQDIIFTYNFMSQESNRIIFEHKIS